MVQLVQSGGSVGSFHSTGFASIFFLHRDSISSVQFSSEMFVYCRIDSTDKSLL